MARTPLGIRAYRLGTLMLSPAVPMLLRQRGRRGKENRDRAAERLGIARLRVHVAAWSGYMAPAMENVWQRFR